MRKGRLGEWWTNLKTRLTRFGAKRAQRHGDTAKARAKAKRAANDPVPVKRVPHEGHVS